MKLRIRGNSLRLRVSRGELAQIAESGYAEDAVRFSPSAALRYRVEVSSDAELGAAFSDEAVRVLLPGAEVRRWLAEDQVSIRGEQPIGDGQVLTILVEKDFACLSPRPDEDDEDLFPNPNAPGA